MFEPPQLRSYLSVIVLLGVSSPSWAQNVVVTSPTQTQSTGDFEFFGTGIQYDDGNVQFSWQPSAVPPFGGYDPSNDARLNIRAGPLSLSLFGSQGSRQSMVTQTPSVTLTNGGTGYFIDTQLQPFVTSFVPVIGGRPVLQGPSIQQRFAETRALPPSADEPQPRRLVSAPKRQVSSAQQGDISVAEIRRQKRAAADPVELLLAKAKTAMQEEKWKLARNHLRNALRKSSDGSADERRPAIYAALERVEAKLSR